MADDIDTGEFLRQLRQFYGDPNTVKSPSLNYADNPWALPPPEPKHEARPYNPQRPADALAPVSEALAPFPAAYSMGQAGAETYLRGRAGDYAGAAESALPLGLAALPIPGAKRVPRVENPIRAYHGSPHDFDRFDLSKIGTGEGAQAYGHGLYFAENEGVARSYRDALGPGRTGYWTGAPEAPHINGKLIENQSDVAAAHWLKVMGDKNYAHAINAAERSALENYSNPGRAAGDRAIADRLREWRDSGTVVDWGKPGRMYEVAIHANPEQFLDWDKPLAAQGRVGEAINDILSQTSPRPSLTNMLFPPDKIVNTHHNYAGTSGTGQHAYSLLRSRGVEDKMAEAGIPGIKYLDQGSRGAGQGTSNYVVWSPEIIEILRKYGVAAPMAAPAFAAAMQGSDDKP